MSEREKKLEAALRKVIYASCNKVLDVVTQQELCEALATPPTSEWNEAIEAAAQMVGCSNGSVPYLVYSIRTLKRKEQL